MEQWQRVLWSDEKKFELFNSKRRQYCRRMTGECLRDDTIQATVKHGGGSIMFWGCFGNSMVGDLKKITGLMTSDMYHQVLVYHAFPSGARIFNDNKTWYFLQDNDFKTQCKESSKLPAIEASSKKLEDTHNGLAFPIPRFTSSRTSLGGV